MFIYTIYNIISKSQYYRKIKIGKFVKPNIIEIWYLKI